MRYALIPVKELDRAKARLAPVLDDGARRELVLAMLRDVLDAALACAALDGVAVVSRDETVLSIAREAGAEALAEPGGLNQALTSAASTLRERSATPLLVLAADLPLADAASISAVLETDADVVVVPSVDGGTSALLVPGGGGEFHFGPDSASKHLAAAEAAGLRAHRVELPRLALDIDTPEHLERLREAGDTIGRHTLAALERSSLLSRPAPNR